MEQCLENPNTVAAASVSWFNNSGMPQIPAYQQEKLYNLFNAAGGPRCNFQQCKFAHKCSACRGPHARAFCRKVPLAGGALAQGGSRAVNLKRYDSICIVH